MAAGRKSALWEHARQRRQTAAPDRPEAAAAPDIRKQMADIRSHFGADGAGASATPWIRAAAVLACFSPTKLRSTAGKTLADDDAFSDVLEASVLAPSSGGLRLLPLAERRKHLRQMGTREKMRQALEANMPLPDVPVQHAFSAILEGEAAVRALRGDEDEHKLAALSEALLWVEDILDNLPPRQDILEDLARLRISSPLRALVGPHFAGREATIDKLNFYFHGKPDADRILFLHGTGGTGKSTVLAKFALDLRESEMVDLIVYLNFDRPALDVREPLTVLYEVVNQLAAQTLDEKLEYLRRDMEEYFRRFSSNRNVLESSFDGGGGWQGMIHGVAQAIEDSGGNGPILILVDTFESAQRMGESAVRHLWRMFTELAVLTPSLRIIAAGRVDSFGLFENTLELSGLERGAVEDVLESICSQPLPADVVDDVFKSTNGRPLGVVLAGHYFNRLGVAKLSNPQTRADALLDVHSEQAEAVLYNRVLGQITDEIVQGLARPGLLLRHVTPGLIRDVLGPVTNQNFDDDRANKVFEAYAHEIDLVEPGLAAWGEPLLTHRADVRALMLHDLRAYDPDQVEKLDRLAVDYFSRLDDGMARAEEIYHLCFLEEGTDTLSARWRTDCAPFLLEAIAEVPVAKRPWLANQLGIDLPPDAQDQASLSEWETYAARTAQHYLSVNSVEDALDVLAQRDDRLPGSPLYALQADALSRLERVTEAREVIDRGIASAANSGMRGAAAELYLIRSLIHERNREFAVAGRDALRAYRIGEDLGLKDMTLRALSVLLRLRRKSDNIAGPSSAELIARANGILDEIGENALRDQPGLMRSLAGELGPTRPDLLARSVQLSGQDVIGAPSQDLLRAEEAATEKLIKGGHEEIADIVAKIETGKQNSLRDLMRTLVNVAIERDVLDVVAAPLANVISAEVDQLIGAFPSASMQKRSAETTWNRALKVELPR